MAAEPVIMVTQQQSFLTGTHSDTHTNTQRISREQQFRLLLTTHCINLFPQTQNIKSVRGADSQLIWPPQRQHTCNNCGTAFASK